tara:strand:- start:4402 stop:4581 length:180 start_codon:yes stop_codon:yes gene_type:complete
MNFIFLVLATLSTIFLAGDVTSRTTPSGLMITLAWLLPVAFALWTLQEAWKLFTGESNF